MQAGAKELVLVDDRSITDSVALKRDLLHEVLHSFGEVRLRVHGTSMLPAIWPGDTVTVRGIQIAQLQLGDIVLFGRDDRLYAHRLIRKFIRDGREFLITRGDRHRQSDPPVSAEEVLGRVESILREGSSVEVKTSPSLFSYALRQLSRL